MIRHGPPGEDPDSRDHPGLIHSPAAAPRNSVSKSEQLAAGSSLGIASGLRLTDERAHRGNEGKSQQQEEGLRGGPEQDVRRQR